MRWWRSIFPDVSGVQKFYEPTTEREERSPFDSAQGRLSTAQPNHLTGSEMGRVKLGCFGRDDSGGLRVVETGLEWGGSWS